MHLLGDARWIVGIQRLGRCYNQIEFKTSEMAAKVLSWSPMILISSFFCFGRFAATDFVVHGSASSKLFRRNMFLFWLLAVVLVGNPGCT